MGHTKRTLFQSGTILAACLMGMSMPAGRVQAAGASEKTLARFTVTDPGRTDPHGLRKVLVVNARRLTGPVAISYRSHSVFVNDELWLPRPVGRSLPPGLTYEALTVDDSTAALKVPFVIRRAVRGKPILGHVNEFYRRKQATGQLVLAGHLDGNSHGKGKAYATTLIDTTIASATLSGPHAPQFSNNGVVLYFPGYGWEGFSRLAEGVRVPGGDITEQEARVRAVDLATAFTHPSRSAVAILGDADMIFRGGSKSQPAADQLDILFGADTLQIDAMLASMGPDDSHGVPRFLLESLRDQLLHQHGRGTR